EAVNGYINIRYDKLSTLSNAAGTGTDPGPRTCSGSVCKITYQTLINEGLLPSTYTGTNANKSSYKIILKRDGTSPNYVINGLITTSTAWIEGGKTRYDLLGKAMQTAGIDSGMTQSSSSVSGYSGAWSNNATDFNNITQAGLLGYRVGYDSAMYSVYLRRDGTLPMTGNLNMGANDIDNAKNITASGTGDFGSDITSGGTVTAAGQVIAHNGYGDMITFGGDAANNDYEIRLGAAKQLTLYSPSAGNYTT
ncbi:shufflon system plasmid conjugative transfer pilus tip adhesin PilV, partial [Citrobacter freundii]|nr:shufflon system plasmid conjugative transfer pilus tip adhesin PilV [Citrobacter freundii]